MSRFGAPERLGSLGVVWRDSTRAQRVKFARTLSDDGHRVDAPKTGDGPVVDMPQQLADTLRKHSIALRAAALEVGVPTDQRLWLFPDAMEASATRTTLAARSRGS